VTGWLENDGDLVTQEVAAARAGFDGPKRAREFRIGDWRGIVLSGEGAEGRVAEACREADLVVTSAEAALVPEGCHVIDAADLATTGALAIRVEGDALILQPTHDAQRMWSPTPVMAPLRIERQARAAVALEG
jgi:competence protein ComEC